MRRLILLQLLSVALASEWVALLCGGAVLELSRSGRQAHPEGEGGEESSPLLSQTPPLPSSTASSAASAGGTAVQPVASSRASATPIVVHDHNTGGREERFLAEGEISAQDGPLPVLLGRHTLGRGGGRGRAPGGRGYLMQQRGVVAPPRAPEARPHALTSDQINQAPLLVPAGRGRGRGGNLVPTPSPHLGPTIPPNAVLPTTTEIALVGRRADVAPAAASSTARSTRPSASSSSSGGSSQQNLLLPSRGPPETTSAQQHTHDPQPASPPATSPSSTAAGIIAAGSSGTATTTSDATNRVLQPSRTSSSFCFDCFRTCFDSLFGTSNSGGGRATAASTGSGSSPPAAEPGAPENYNQRGGGRGRFFFRLPRLPAWLRSLPTSVRRSTSAIAGQEEPTSRHHAHERPPEGQPPYTQAALARLTEAVRTGPAMQNTLDFQQLDAEARRTIDEAVAKLVHVVNPQKQTFERLTRAYREFRKAVVLADVMNGCGVVDHENYNAAGSSTTPQVDVHGITGCCGTRYASRKKFLETFPLNGSKGFPHNAKEPCPHCGKEVFYSTLVPDGERHDVEEMRRGQHGPRSGDQHGEQNDIVRVKIQPLIQKYQAYKPHANDMVDFITPNDVARFLRKRQESSGLAFPDTELVEELQNQIRNLRELLDDDGRGG
ncbi:unnamed protein product [Amoebophrya sp. A120]|nr:unnamed protein product [Amoebophrya sp. A120]|eukprot:GSA120T00001026001.1